jgi:uroporphyrinogen-III synthase
LRILITRPREDAEGFAARLAACGVESLIVPLMDVVFDRDATIDLEGVAAVLLTSANGARALAALGTPRGVPVIAVGPATAGAARQAGFDVAAVAGGDVVRLAETVRATLKPEAGALLHVSGSVVAGDLAGRLGEDGYTVRRVTAYSARAADILPAAATTALQAASLDGAAFFSPRSAALFARLVSNAGLGGTIQPLAGYCLSEAVARELSRPPWGALHVALRPDGDALAGLICAHAGRP